MPTSTIRAVLRGAGPPRLGAVKKTYRGHGVRWAVAQGRCSANALSVFRHPQVPAPRSRPRSGVHVR